MTSRDVQGHDRTQQMTFCRSAVIDDWFAPWVFYFVVLARKPLLVCLLQAIAFLQPVPQKWCPGTVPTIGRSGICDEKFWQSMCLT